MQPQKMRQQLPKAMNSQGLKLIGAEGWDGCWCEEAKMPRLHQLIEIERDWPSRAVQKFLEFGG